MNKQAYLCAILLVASLIAAGQEMVLEGVYCGKNLYFQNPKVDTGFCMEKVSVNGREISFEGSTGVEIRLDTLGLKDGNKIEVRVSHKSG